MPSSRGTKKPPILERMAPKRRQQKQPKKVPKLLELDNYQRRLTYSKNTLTKKDQN